MLPAFDAPVVPMHAYAFRIGPHRDLLEALDASARAYNLQAGCVLACCGSLRRAALRLADKPNTTIYDGKFEIVALTGTLSIYGAHYHIALSDGEGRTIGGHLMPGNLIYTTAEIVIGVLPQQRFLREFDPEAGYEELVVRGD